MCLRLLMPMTFLAILVTRANSQTTPAAGEQQQELQRTIAERIESRTFPSVFQAWNPADNLKNEDKWTTVARHDLLFHSPRFFGLKWNNEHEGLATGFRPETLTPARQVRQNLLRRNPSTILLAELRYRDAHRSYLPQDHRWWKRDAQGKLVMGWEEGGYIQLDFHQPEYRRHLAAQAEALMRTGVFDGIMLDWWSDDEDRLELVKTIREAIGDKALILANANDRQTPKTAPFVNGYFMECYRSRTAKDWQRIADTLRWAEEHLREPRINCVETWFHQSRDDLNLMRATTALTLVLSNGYCLFSDPNPLPTPDHLHNWYGFWDKRLGKPVKAFVARSDGSYEREFQNGVVVYNPMGNRAVTVSFPQPWTSVATNRTENRFVIDPADGDILLKPQE